MSFYARIIVVVAVFNDCEEVMINCTENFPTRFVFLQIKMWWDCFWWWREDKLLSISPLELFHTLDLQVLTSRLKQSQDSFSSFNNPELIQTLQRRSKKMRATMTFCSLETIEEFNHSVLIQQFIHITNVKKYGLIKNKWIKVSFLWNIKRGCLCFQDLLLWLHL